MDNKITLLVILIFLLITTPSFSSYGTSKLYFSNQGCSPPTIGNWNITDTQTVLCQDKYIVLNGNLTIYGMLVFKNTTLGINNSFDGENNITVFNGGIFAIYDKDGSRETTVDASNITSYNTSNPFNFIVSNGATFEILNSFLSWAGWSSGNEGLEIFSSNVTIANTSLLNNFVGIFFSGSHNDTIESSTINNSSYNNIQAVSSSYNITLLNTTFNKTNVSILDTSNITVKWYANIFVTDGISPVDGAALVITDNKSTTVFFGTTNSSGYIPRQILVEMIMNSTTNDYYTPHLIFGSKTGYVSNSTLENINQSKLITLVLTPIITPTGGGGMGGGAPPSSILDTTVTIEPGSELVAPGGDVYASINIRKVGGPTGYLNVNLSYRIRDTTGNIISEKMETVAVSDDPRGSTFLRSLSLPVDAKEGRWSFEATGYYGTSSDTSLASFDVMTAAPGLSIVEYPEEFTIRQGDVDFTTIRVQNIGNKYLLGVKAVVQGVPSYWYSVDPGSVDLAPNTGQTFIVKFTIPEQATIRGYNILYKAYSGPIVDEKSAVLDVRGKTFQLIEVKDIQVSGFSLNQKGNIKITLTNKGTNPIDTTVTLNYSKNFFYDQNTITQTLEPEVDTNFNFYALSDQIGTFTINMLVDYEGGEIKKDIIVNVYPVGIEILILILLGIIFSAMVILLWRKRRRRYERMDLSRLRTFVRR